MSELINCLFPENTGLTGQRYGCRCKRCKQAKLDATKRYRLKNFRKYNQTTAQYRRKLKEETFKAYGGLLCACCSENQFLFLSLDHVNNDGFIERRIMKHRGAGTQLYLRLKRQGYPQKERFQVLCMNCNFGKKLNNGICPHKLDTKVEAY